MKYFKLLFICLIIIGISGCFNTRDKRKKAAPFDLSLLKDSDGQNDPSDDNSDDRDSGDDKDNGDPPPPAHIAHCKWSKDGQTNFEFNSSHIGDYTLCQSTNTKTDLFFQAKTNPGYKICFIPVNEDGSNVNYIGEPRCLTPSSSMTVYKIVILKNRPSSGGKSYSGLTMTGVMIMQDRAYEFPSPYYPYYNLYNNPLKAPDAYMLCANWFQAGYPQYCQSFNQAGHYVYHKF